MSKQKLSGRTEYTQPKSHISGTYNFGVTICTNYDRQSVSNMIANYYLVQFVASL